MSEVDKMRSSQLANTASPEIQERFKRAKKLLLQLFGRLSVATMVTVSVLGNMSLSIPIVLSWTVVTSLSERIR